MFATYQRLGVSVWASPREVIRAARHKLAKEARKGLLYRAKRHRFYREMLRHHKTARNLCTTFRL